MLDEGNLKAVTDYFQGSFHPLADIVAIRRFNPPVLPDLGQYTFEIPRVQEQLDRLAPEVEADFLKGLPDFFRNSAELAILKALRLGGPCSSKNYQLLSLCASPVPILLNIDKWGDDPRGIAKSSFFYITQFSADFGPERVFKAVAGRFPRDENLPENFGEVTRIVSTGHHFMRTAFLNQQWATNVRPGKDQYLCDVFGCATALDIMGDAAIPALHSYVTARHTARTLEFQRKAALNYDEGPLSLTHFINTARNQALSGREALQVGAQIYDKYNCA